MDVRTYRGRQMNEVMTRIKQELGESAYILSTAVIDNGVEVRVGKTSGVVDENTATAIESDVQNTKGRQRLITLDNVMGGDIYSLLSSQGLDSRLINQITAKIDASSAGATNIDQVIARGLARVAKFDSQLTGGQKIVALVGATGVGKTTTIAKLAAKMRMSFSLKIGLISADSFRVGAGAQLQSYAQLLKVPCKSIEPNSDQNQQLHKILASYRHMDLIFIDTAGCSPREVERINQLERSLHGMRQIEKILVLPAPSNPVDLGVSLKAFDRIGYSRIVISKLDESGYIGPVLSSAISTGKPIGFLTTGQKVPEDIEPASARRLAWMLSRSIN